MKGTFTVAADRPTVWACLHDPDFLRGCLRECETLRRVDATRYLGAAHVRLGPFRMLWRGLIEFQDVDPLQRWKMVVRGMGRLEGLAAGRASVELEDTPDGTAVAYALEADLGRRFMRLGGRLVDAAAHRVADRFFANVAAGLVTEVA